MRAAAPPVTSPVHGRMQLGGSMYVEQNRAHERNDKQRTAAHSSAQQRTAAHSTASSCMQQLAWPQPPSAPAHEEAAAQQHHGQAAQRLEHRGAQL